VLDDQLVRAAVRQYLKARVRVLKRNADPRRRVRFIRRHRQQAERYRARDYVGTRGHDVVLKPARTRKKSTRIVREKELAISIRRY